MDKILEHTLLFDFYGELLTEKQKHIYELYYQDDLSLAEISEEVGISRQGVHDAVKKCDKQLRKFENKLRMVERFVVLRNMVTEIDTISREATSLAEGHIKDKLLRLSKLTADMKEQL